MTIQKSGTFSIPGQVLLGCGTSWHKSGTSRIIRDRWQPYVVVICSITHFRNWEPGCNYLCTRTRF